MFPGTTPASSLTQIPELGRKLETNREIFQTVYMVRQSV